MTAAAGAGVLGPAVARLAGGPVYGEPVAACAGCAVPLVELVLPVRVRVVVGGLAAGLVLTHGHAALDVERGAAGRACGLPRPAGCASPRCPLYAVPGGRWCRLCGA